MSRKGINIILIVLASVIVAFVAKDIISSFFLEKPVNPYKFSLDEHKIIDPDFIKYHETKQIKTNSKRDIGISWFDENIYLLSDSSVKIINPDGRLNYKIQLNDEPKCICVSSKQQIIVGFKNYISLFDTLGNVLESSEVDNIESVFTSIASSGNLIYVADAGKRRVIYYDSKANLIGEFRGESGSKAIHGFVIPSPTFDLDFNNKGELWVVNSGMHTFQHYSANGKLLASWGKASVEIDGFSGCCNPAHFTFGYNGHFFTSEKGLVRIKEFNPEGELVAVVAAPNKFKDEGKAPDLTIDDKGTIIALDMDKNLIRFFEPNH